MKCADHHIDVIATLHRTAFVGKNNPVGFAALRRGALAQLSHILQRWDYQLYTGPRVDEGRLELLVIEHFGLIGVEYAIAEANDLTRLAPPDHEVIDAPNEPVIGSGASRKAIGVVAACPGARCRSARACRSGCRHLVV